METQDSRIIRVKNGKAQIMVVGFFFYRDFLAGSESASGFLTDFLAGHADFDQCFGAYRIELRLEDGSQVIFADNAGTTCWFLCEKTGQVSNRLQEFAPVVNWEPNYNAIAQFLYFSCIYGLDTPLKSVQRSDPEKYYCMKNGKIEAHSKQLTPISQLPYDEYALETHMRRCLQAVGEQYPVGCTITGGIDSRTILSHLLANGKHPLLSITGDSNLPDVQIAEKISQITGLELWVYDPSQLKDAAWLDDALEAADGLSGACSLYRLHKQAEGLRQKGIFLNFGGGAGELYKNSFLNQDYPFYGGKPNWEKFLRMKVATYDFPMRLCGERLRPEMESTTGRILSDLKQFSGETKAASYLEAGYKIMQCRGITSSNMTNRQCAFYTPLMERPVAAWSWHQSPHSLEMQYFQRRETSRLCPSIKSVETDRGLTCDVDRMHIEWLKSLLFLVKVAMGRIFKRGKVQSQTASISTQSHETEQYRRAMAVCRDLGILASDTEDGTIPNNIADKLLTIGHILDNQTYKKELEK